MTKISCAIYQMNASEDPDKNASDISSAVREAKRNGANYFFTPENSNFIREGKEYSLEHADSDTKHHFLNQMRAVAQECQMHLFIGSIKYRVGDLLRNRSIYLDPQGKSVAYYDKMHLFDVTVSETESYKESDMIEPGEHVMVARTPDFTAGFSVCYDLRFPYLFSDMALRGANVIMVPAAFTVPTGQAHWHVLLRARAIETGCFIIAAAQTGEHYGGRKTFGHSLAVNPNGEILCEAKSEAPENLYFNLDLSQVETARRKIPCLQHYRNLYPVALPEGF